MAFKEQRGIVSNDETLARAVYGPEHFDKEHKGHQTYYKPRYLRVVKNNLKKIYGFPQGLPGGWSKQRKVHFIAHSQGAQTVRYLQYLMSIDYFSLPGEPKTDKSDWFASVTTVSACFNGVPLLYALLERESGLQKVEEDRFLETWHRNVIIYGWPIVCAVLNCITPGGTKDTEQENVTKILKQNKNSSGFPFLRHPSNNNHDALYELGNQNQVVFDLKAETGGFNRRKSETLKEYLVRLQSHDLVGTSLDYALPELVPEQMEKYNEKIQTYAHTYYFSYTTGERNRTAKKLREVLAEPKRTTEQLLGFDSDVIKNIKLHGSVR